MKNGPIAAYLLAENGVLALTPEQLECNKYSSVLQKST